MSFSPVLPRPTALLLTAILAAGSVLAACGGDDGADVRELGDGGGSASGSATASGASGSASGTASHPASGSASGTASGTEPGSASASGVGGSGCDPVGEELRDGTETVVEVQLADYEFVPAEIQVDPGVVTFETSNIGSVPHELGFLPGGGEVPFTEPGQPDEEALAEMGAFELEAYGPDQECTATFELEAGEYTIFCLIPAGGGETHYERGMAGTVTVG